MGDVGTASLWISVQENLPCASECSCLCLSSRGLVCLPGWCQGPSCNGWRMIGLKSIILLGFPTVSKVIYCSYALSLLQNLPLVSIIWHLWHYSIFCLFHYFSPGMSIHFHIPDLSNIPPHVALSAQWHYLWQWIHSLPPLSLHRGCGCRQLPFSNEPFPHLFPSLPFGGHALHQLNCLHFFLH